MKPGQVFIYPASCPLVDGKRLIVEVGPGRGDFLFHLAEKNPESVIVGIEIKAKRVDKLIRRIEHRGLKNVRIIQADARDALLSFFAKSSIDEIHILFPDPWPKRRHEKNRAVSETFLRDCLAALKPDGVINFVTDHAAYAEAAAAVFATIDGFESCYAERISTKSDNEFPTFFAQKWLSMGRKISYQRYRRTIPTSGTNHPPRVGICEGR